MIDNTKRLQTLIQSLLAEVDCGLEDDEWVFSVADNGIAPRHQERILKIFRRLHSYGQVPGPSAAGS